MLFGTGYTNVLLLASTASPRSKAIYSIRLSLGYALAFPSSLVGNESEIDPYWFLESNAHCIADSHGRRTGVCEHELSLYSDRLVRCLSDELQPSRGGGG
jgi:hypothetical protein